MKRFLTVLLCLLVLVPVARADGPDDQYVAIYSIIQKGDTLSEKGQVAQGIARYREAESALKLFKTNYPDWNVKVVEFRLKYLANKISDLSSQPATVAPSAATPTAVAPSAAAPAPAATAPATPMAVTRSEPAPANVPTNTPAEMSSNVPPPMEAAAPAPAPVSAPTPAPAPASASADSEHQIAQLQERIHELESDKSLLQAKLKEALAAQPATIDPQELAKAQDQVKDLQKQNELLKASLAEGKTNTATITSTSMSDQDAAALREENALLKKQLGEIQARVASGPSADETSQKLKEAQTQLAALQSEKEILRLQNVALEDHVKQLSAAPAVPVSTPPMLDSVTAARIAKLEAQRNELQLSLDAAARDLQGNKKGKETSARIDEMSRELAGLRAQIEVLEAKPVPYTPTELTLLSPPNTTLMAAAHNHKPAKELPARAGILQSEAQRYFVAHQLDKAEAKYLELLKLDEKNVATLSDLASIEIELGHDADAEKYLKAALAVEPDDDYSLFVLGQLKFRQKSYDDALDALSRAAGLNPQNPKIQNFLGLTLTEKGLRGPAETAFRKAIQYDPGFADAHLNLAVVYITQQPPLVELARWHYQKALAVGHAPNPDLEKLLNAAGTSSASTH